MLTMRWLLPLFYTAAAAALELKYEAWPGNGGKYVHVSNADADTPQIECKESGDYVMQLDPDSVLVDGAVSGRPQRLNDYGVGPASGEEETPTTAFERMVFGSGLFLPEMDPCWYSSRRDDSIPYTQRSFSGEVCNGYADAWYQWIGEKDFIRRPSSQNYAESPPGQGVTHLKYAPTGALNLREAGSANANIQVYETLSKLNPPQRDANSAPFEIFNRVSRSMWGICDNQECASLPTANEQHSAFPGMMPTLHPVFDGIFDYESYNCAETPNDCYSSPFDRETEIKKERSKDNVVAREQARLAVKRCPNATDNECCLSIEGDNTGVELEKVSWMATYGNENETRSEYKLRWNTVAVHTSFSRGVPDQRFYSASAVQNDIVSRANNNMVNRQVLIRNNTIDKEIIDHVLNFHKYSQNEAINSGFAGFGNGYSRLDDSPLREQGMLSTKCTVKHQSKVDFRMAFYLEHYYTALVGNEEKLALGQANAFEEYDRKRYADEVKNTDKTATKAHHEACGNMPGGHCGHGYSCNRPNKETHTQPHDLIECMPTHVQFQQDPNYSFAHQNADAYGNKFDTSPISGKYHGLADTWDKGTLLPSARDGTEAEYTNLFVNRVRGRPELVQWYQDGIYYSGNRGRPSFGSGLQWPCQWPPPDKDHRWCDPTGRSGPNMIGSSLDAEEHGCVWVTDWRNGGTDRYVCKPPQWPSSTCQFWPPNWVVGSPPPGCFNAPMTGCKADKDINPDGNGTDYYNCVDIEYEFDVRKSYMSYAKSYYPHALDDWSTGLVGLKLKYRMSARDIFTYGENKGYSHERTAKDDRNPYFAMWGTMLPCRGERGVGRSCFNMKATKYEAGHKSLIASIAKPI